MEKTIIIINTVRKHSNNYVYFKHKSHIEFRIKLFFSLAQQKLIEESNDSRRKRNVIKRKKKKAIQ